VDQMDLHAAWNGADQFSAVSFDTRPTRCSTAVASCATVDTSTIDVWLWSLSPPTGTLERYWRNLNPEERARAARFSAPRLQDQYVAGRGGMRDILGQYLHRAPRSVPIHCNVFGKPQLANGSAGALHFNLSHTGGLAALAVSPTFDVGIDIEEMRSIGEPIAERFFSAAEAEALRHISCDRSLQAFYKCWTSKEAFVKAHGAGLSLPLDSFEVSVDPDRPPALINLAGDHTAADHWSLLALDLPAGLSGTVAALTVGNRVALRYRDMAETYDGEV
jgi:4'-phosphopantetheinyl transferase